MNLHFVFGLDLVLALSLVLDMVATMIPILGTIPSRALGVNS